MNGWIGPKVVGECMYVRTNNNNSPTEKGDSGASEATSSATVANNGDGNAIDSGVDGADEGAKVNGGTTPNTGTGSGKDEGPWFWLGPVLGSVATIIAAFITVYCVRNSRAARRTWNLDRMLNILN